MLSNFFWVVTLCLGTTFVHTLCTVAILVWLDSASFVHWTTRNAFTRGMLLAGLVLGMSLVAYLQAMLWALFYLTAGALPSLEDAIYFSLVTFTTLGYGDITLDPQWRVAGAFQAANGIILFGWTTALIVAVGQRVLRRAD
jgi:hypothetical protein